MTARLMGYCACWGLKAVCATSGGPTVPASHRFGRANRKVLQLCGCSSSWVDSQPRAGKGRPSELKREFGRLRTMVMDCLTRFHKAHTHREHDLFWSLAKITGFGMFGIVLVYFCTLSMTQWWCIVAYRKTMETGSVFLLFLGNDCSWYTCAPQKYMRHQ